MPPASVNAPGKTQLDNTSVNTADITADITVDITVDIICDITPGIAADIAADIRDKGALFYIEPEQLVAFYAEHNPAYVANVDEVLRQHSAQKIIDSCQKKYGAQPTTTPRAKGGLSVVNVMGNHIGKEMLFILQEIMRSKPNLVSLCGIADDATEADLSRLDMDPDDAIILASELPDKGALTKLTFGEKQPSGVRPHRVQRRMQGVVTMITEMTEANFGGKLKSYEGQIVAAFLPKCT
jgi:hypothetical protein